MSSFAHRQRSPAGELFGEDEKTFLFARRRTTVRTVEPPRGFRFKGLKRTRNDSVPSVVVRGHYTADAWRRIEFQFSNLSKPRENSGNTTYGYSDRLKR